MGGRALVRRIASVEGRAARLALWAEAMASLPPAEAAQVLDAVVLGAASRSSQAVKAYLPLLDLPTLEKLANPGRLASVLLAARELELEGALLLLEHPGPSQAPCRLGPPPDPIVDTISLGHRKTAARGRRTPVLGRILKDPDPRVVTEVLRNPRLRETEVVAIASRRPCAEEVFWHLVRSETWMQRPGVHRAVAHNPYAPPQLATALTVLLPDSDLRVIAKEEGLHPGVRDGALQVLVWRRGTET